MNNTGGGRVGRERDAGDGDGLVLRASDEGGLGVGTGGKKVDVVVVVPVRQVR